MSARKTILTQLEEINYDKIRFSLMEDKNTNAKQNGKRIDISYENKNGSVGSLVLPTPPGLYSLGVLPSKLYGTENVTGYNMPIFIYSQIGGVTRPTPKQKLFVDVVNKISKKCNDYLIENNKIVGKSKSDIEKIVSLDPFWWKKNEHLEKDYDHGPTLYGKLVISKKRSKDSEEKKDVTDGSNMTILTKFTNTETRKEIENPLTIGRCHVTAGICIESLFIGAKITLQLKIREANVKPLQSNFEKLLPETEDAEDETSESVLPKPDEDDKDGIVEDEQPPVVSTAPPPPKPVVTKKTTKLK